MIGTAKIAKGTYAALPRFVQIITHLRSPIAAIRASGQRPDDPCDIRDVSTDIGEVTEYIYNGSHP
jgi:hypothetical protein